MSNIWAVGDVHGRLDLLQSLLKRLEKEQDLNLTKDKLIFLGDFIDRGPDSRGVINTIMQLQALHPNNVIALRGNHEIMALNACAMRHHGHHLELWLYNGGKETITSYRMAHVDETENSNTINPFEPDVPKVFGPMMSAAHLDWIVKLPLFHREPGFFFSHAPVPDDDFRFNNLKGEEEFSDHELTWTYFSFNDEEHCSRVFKNNVVGVCGHIHRLREKKFEPRLYDNYIYTDAGCGCFHKAGLAAVEVKSRTVVQVNPDGWEGRENE